MKFSPLQVPRRSAAAEAGRARARQCRRHRRVRRPILLVARRSRRGHYPISKDRIKKSINDAGQPWTLSDGRINLLMALAQRRSAAAVAHRPSLVQGIWCDVATGASHGQSADGAGIIATPSTTSQTCFRTILHMDRVQLRRNGDLPRKTYEFTNNSSRLRPVCDFAWAGFGVQLRPCDSRR